MDEHEPEGWRAWHTVVRLPEFPVEVERTALIVIDVTYQQASRHHGMCQRIAQKGNGDDLEYYLTRMEGTVVSALRRLTDAFRSYGQPVIYTRCVSIRGDGSDQTWRHRAFGLVCGLGSKDAELLAEIAPQDGDIVLNKTGSSVFTSTNCEHLLRNMGITTVVVTGIFTNSCVEGTIRDAGDLDFRVLMAEDACAAMTPSGHRKTLDYLDGNFCHAKAAEEILALLATSASGRLAGRERLTGADR
jgi:nicotinamidase-related amidase